MTEPRAAPAALLFDLDGTLLDTAPDLAAALNALRAERRLPPLPLAAIRPWVSLGSSAMTCRGLGIEETAPDFTVARRRFLDLYGEQVAVHTRLFAGMDDVLRELERAGMPWGIVTNKPAWLTQPLLARLGLATRAACAVSGDSTRDPKPSPAPLLHAAALIGIDPVRCVYVGDAQRDIEAGRRAGMYTIVALYGYLGDGECPDRWGADASIATPADLRRWLAARLT